MCKDLIYHCECCNIDIKTNGKQSNITRHNKTKKHINNMNKKTEVVVEEKIYECKTCKKQLKLKFKQMNKKKTLDKYGKDYLNILMDLNKDKYTFNKEKMYENHKKTDSHKKCKKELKKLKAYENPVVIEEPEPVVKVNDKGEIEIVNQKPISKKKTKKQLAIEKEKELILAAFQKEQYEDIENFDDEYDSEIDGELEQWNKQQQEESDRLLKIVIEV